MAGALPLCALAALLALASVALGACGGDDDEEESAVVVADIDSSLPTASELGLKGEDESEVDVATDLFTFDGLVIGGDTEPNTVGTALEDAGFQGAAGIDTGAKGLNVRIRVLQFDSEEGAAEAQDVLHEEDLKTPCPDACIVTPLEYELEDIPDSTAVHHVPTNGDLPPGQSPVEAHHGEFVIGSKLYLVQMDGEPSPSFSADFEKLMGTVYESASSAG